MADADSFWSGMFVMAALAGGLYYCSPDKEPQKQQPSFTATGLAASEGASPPTVSVAVATPKHNYSEKEGSTYFYISGLSDEEKAKGMASGKVLEYRYGGKDDKGAHIVLTPYTRYTCSVPCKIIKSSSGDRIAYNEDSMIGAVFQDAMRGYLQAVPSKPKPKPETFSEDVTSDGPWTGYKKDPIVTTGSTEKADSESNTPSEQPSAANE